VSRPLHTQSARHFTRPLSPSVRRTVKAQLRVYEDTPWVEVRSASEVDKYLFDATREARLCARSNVVFIRAGNGNQVSLVVGEAETALGFTFGHGNPPYFVSEGIDGGVEPVFTAFVSSTHHTEYPRSSVVPWGDGLSAVHEFIKSGNLPSAISWQEV